MCNEYQTTYACGHKTTTFERCAPASRSWLSRLFHPNAKKCKGVLYLKKTHGMKQCRRCSRISAKERYEAQEAWEAEYQFTRAPRPAPVPPVGGGGGSSQRPQAGRDQWQPRRREGVSERVYRRFVSDRAPRRQATHTSMDSWIGPPLNPVTDSRHRSYVPQAQPPPPPPKPASYQRASRQRRDSGNSIEVPIMHPWSSSGRTEASSRRSSRASAPVLRQAYQAATYTLPSTVYRRPSRASPIVSQAYEAATYTLPSTVYRRPSHISSIPRATSSVYSQPEMPYAHIRPVAPTGGRGQSFRARAQEREMNRLFRDIETGW